MSAQLQARKRVKYSPDSMSMAMHAVRTGALSKRAAAKMYGVPKTTLLDKLAGRVPEQPTPPGKKPVLTKEEEATLVRYSSVMSEIGYPLTKAEFLREVKRILDIDGRSTPFPDNLPGHKWFKNFTKRNSDICMRTPMALGHERSQINMGIISSWYDTLRTYLKREVPDYENLVKNPRRIFNGDESGFPLSVKPGKVLAQKGSRNVYHVVTSSKVQITVMVAFNAFGDYVPPLILFPGQRLRDTGLGGFPEARYAVTKNGWMDSETFVSFLKCLVEHVTDKQIDFPILFFVDGHSTHISLEAAEYCHDKNVILYCLPPNTTHVLQACDIGFFSPMKAVWKQVVKEWQLQNIGIALSKKDFPALFKTTWDRVATFENAVHAFSKSGMFPLTPEGIDQSKLGPSKMVTSSLDVSSTSIIDDEPENGAGNEQTNDTLPASSTVTETGDAAVTTLQPSTSNNASVLGAHQQSANPVLTTETDATLSNTVQASITSSITDNANVSDAFSMLNVPKPKQKRTTNTMRKKLPKAISGLKAIEMLKERENKKKTELEAKEKRKQDRIRKRIEKEAEKENKRKEKAEKKKASENKKEAKIRKRKRPVVSQCDSSDTNDDSDNLTYSDSDEIDEDFQMCPACSKGDQHPSKWVKCAECGTRWHYMCANRPEYELLDETERKKLEFVCPLCL